MRRRGFLHLLGRGAGAATAAAVAPTVTAQILTGPRAKTAVTGFGLAAVKKEGASAAYDTQFTGNFARALYPGVKKWWKESYS